MDFDDIKDYAISSIPIVGSIYAGVREGRAARRHAKRQEEAQLRSARAGAVARALSGKRHSGPAFSVIEKGVIPPDMTSIAIQKGLANLGNQLLIGGLAKGAGGPGA